MDTMRQGSQPQSQGRAAAATQARVGGLLLAFSIPPEGAEDEFNAWYDEDHAPVRMTVPGFLNGRRYIATSADGPRYMATYDLDAPEAVQSPDYQRLSEQRTEREKAMLPRLPLLDRRVLKTVIGGAPWTEDAPFVLAVGLQPATGAEDDLRAWYREEHIPLLLRVPGWRRARLFEQVEGSGPQFVALHELESDAVFQTPEYRAATSTPWRDRVIGGVTRRERCLYRLFRTLPRPSWGTP